jgi:hypothetical protein
MCWKRDAVAIVFTSYSAVIPQVKHFSATLQPKLAPAYGCYGGACVEVKQRHGVGAVIVLDSPDWRLAIAAICHELAWMPGLVDRNHFVIGQQLET